MKRLTIRNSDGTVSQPTATTVEEAFYRLADYEDTGLTPEELSEIALANKEGRLFIKRRPTEKTCGSCSHFCREKLGRASGHCNARKDRRTRSALYVSQSRKACLDYKE
ncbi:MAG: hypothetical protein IJD35_00415 [Clostridia bacterium]|nr:hypothetical protein [Clostridia bacterium]